MIGLKQAFLEEFYHSTSQKHTCTNYEYNQLLSISSNIFNNPLNLKIDILEDIRPERNPASHPE